VSTTIPQRPDEVVLGVQPGEQTAATQVDRWLQAYASSRDPRLREQIILAYLGLADRSRRASWCHNQRRRCASRDL
jgi:hypothetical protein